MILEIAGLGIIKQARIDLNKKFILFCGRNGTGKTYASYILQAFLQDGNLYKLDCFDRIMEEMKAKGSFQIEKDYVTQWLTANCNSVRQHLGNVFGISDATVVKLFSKFSLAADYTEEDYGKLIDTSVDIQWTDGNNYLNATKQAGSTVVSVDGNIDIQQLYPSSIKAVTFLCHILRYMVFRNISEVRMLTVERNSIYTFKTELSLSRNELIDQIQQTGKSEIDVLSIINRSSRRYPQAVRSSLRIANDLENISKKESKFADVATMIEQDLLLGEVSTTKNGDVEFQGRGMAKGKRLPFHLSSSIVKTMASLVIYLRHLANVGDTLIVDEPEMNFHPDVQVMLARIFAMLSTRGLRVVVSTHSDYIIREINNLIMAGTISRDEHKQLPHGIGYSQDMLLDREDMSVLYFERKGKTSVQVNALQIDNDGFVMPSMDEAIADQNMTSEKLLALLLDD